ncbi:anti-sigma factor domain-containing protein [Chryseomicrobium palamuruense]|uniref:Anti-sigma-W factor RsiW n=1 Tax=Chryseomicrobium palamuruense TaxID=682973 RepID=A0ABV8UWZ6_9BACL
MERLMCEQTIDYFNGQLTEDEQKAFEDHLTTCADCQQELAEWQMLAEDLPYVSESVEPPVGMKERVLSSILDEGRQVSVPSEQVLDETIEKAPQSSPVLPFKKPAKRQHATRFMPLVAAALVISLVGNAFLGWTVQNQRAAIDTQSETVDQLIALVNLQPLEGDSTGTASIVRHGDEIRVVVQASSLPELADEEVYQVWLIDSEDESGPDRAGTFTSSGTDGAVVYTLPVGQEFSWDQIAVSHEPNKDSETPLGDVLMASAISAPESE